IRADAIPELNYQDESGRHEYVVFSHSARQAGIPQYLDSRQIYGYITFAEGDSHYVANGIEQARALLRGTGDYAKLIAEGSAAPAGAANRMPIYLINLDRSTERLRLFRNFNGHLSNV